MKKIESFNRSNVRELSDELQKRLDAISKELGINLQMAGARYSDDKVTYRVEATIISDSGTTKVSDSHHSHADTMVRMNGLEFTSPHFIGSIWKKGSDIFRVTDYVSKRSRYPIVCQKAGSNKVKCAISFLKGAEELTQPDFLDFETWFLVDPEDDRVSQKDVDAYDRVDDYMNGLIEEQEFFDAVDELAKCRKRTIKQTVPFVYQMLFEKNLGAAYTTNYINEVVKADK